MEQGFTGSCCLELLPRCAALMCSTLLHLACHHLVVGGMKPVTLDAGVGIMCGIMCGITHAFITTSRPAGGARAPTPVGDLGFVEMTQAVDVAEASWQQVCVCGGSFGRVTLISVVEGASL